MQVRVVRQIRGVDSNKLQPIIRSHPDKDFKVPHGDIPPFDYQYIINGLERDKTARILKVN